MTCPELWSHSCSHMQPLKLLSTQAVASMLAGNITSRMPCLALVIYPQAGKLSCELAHIAGTVRTNGDGATMVSDSCKMCLMSCSGSAGRLLRFRSLGWIGGGLHSSQAARSNETGALLKPKGACYLIWTANLCRGLHKET